MKILKTLFLILLFAIPAFPCGAVADLHGRIVSSTGRGVQATVYLEPTSGGEALVTRSNYFGFYRFPMGLQSCPDAYAITVEAKRDKWERTLFWYDGDGIDLEVNVFGESFKDPRQSNVLKLW